MPSPLSFLKTAQGHPMLVELKNGETYNGHLVNSDSGMNIHLREVICTSKDGDRFWRMPACHIRGITIKYLRVHDEVKDKFQEEKNRTEPLMEMEKIRTSMDPRDRASFLMEFYDTQRLARRFDRVDGTNWSARSINLFKNKMESLRLSCTRPCHMNSSILNFNVSLEQTRMKSLYEEIKSEKIDKCSVCFLAASSIIKCGHKFCFHCIYKVGLGAAKCPLCRSEFHAYAEVSRLSLKLEEVMSKVRLSVNRYGDSRKVVVLCSCLVSLKLLKGGLAGYRRDAVIWEDNMSSGVDIENFLNSDVNILLLPLKALIGEIVLPSYSTVLIVDTVVTDVRNYIFQRIKTIGKDTLSKVMYISTDTIEELIALEPECEDRYGMIDDFGDFAGQIFKKRDRSLVLLHTTQELYGLFEDPGEEAEEVEIF